MFARLVRMARRGTPEIDTVLATPGLLLALEPRYVFDAGAVATAAEAAGAETNAAYDGPAEAADAADAPQPGDVAVAGEAPGEGRAREIVLRGGHRWWASHTGGVWARYTQVVRLSAP